MLFAYLECLYRLSDIAEDYSEKRACLLLLLSCWEIIDYFRSKMKRENISKLRLFHYGIFFSIRLDDVTVGV